MAYASKAGGIAAVIDRSSVVPFAIQLTSRAVPICQLRPSLKACTRPSNKVRQLLSLGFQMFATSPGALAARDADGKYRGRALTRTTSRLGTVWLYVVVAAWSVVVAPATPEEPGDQEHPQEDPYEPGSAQHHGCYHRKDNDQRRHPEHR